MGPQHVEYRLHLHGAGGCCDDCVVFRQDHTELSEGAVAAVTVPCHPELKAIPLSPIRVQLVWCIDLDGGCLSSPFLGNQLGVTPSAALQVELPELRDVLRAGMQAAEALLQS